MYQSVNLVVNYYSDVISAAQHSLLLQGYRHNTMLPAARTILPTAQNIYSGTVAAALLNRTLTSLHYMQPLQVLALRTEVVELVARLRPIDAAATLKWCTLLRLADDTGELIQPDASNSINYCYQLLQHSSHSAAE
jgi:hypothetical protein